MLLGAYCWTLRPALVLQHNEPGNYANEGEALIHDIPLHGNTFRLSLANIAAGLIFYHSGLSTQAWARLFYAAQGALVFFSGSLLMEALWPAAAAAARFFSLGPSSIGPQYPQSLFSILILIAAGLLILRARDPSLRRTVLAALSLGATFLFRSTLVFFPPILALFEALTAPRASPRAKRKELLILGLLPYLFLLPTLKLNWTVHHRLIPFENGASSFNMVTGALGLTGTADGIAGSLIDDPSVDPQSTGAVFGWALAQIRRHPSRYFGAVGRRLAYVIGFNPLLWLLAFLSLWIYRDQKAIATLGLLSLYFLFVHCLMSIQDDYFIPLWPLLCVLAAAPVLLLGTRPAGRSLVQSRISEGIVMGGLVLVAALCVYTSVKTFFFQKDGCSDDACYETALNAALAAHPEDSWLLSQRGGWELRRSKIPEALQDFSRVLRLEPGNRLVALQRDGIRASQGDAAALEAWELPPAAGERRREFPQATTFTVYVLKTLVLLRQGRVKDAREMIEGASRWQALGLTHLLHANSEYEKAILARLRASDTRFADDCLEASYYWPAKDRLALLDLVAKAQGPDLPLRLRQAELAIQSGDRTSALAFLRRAEGLQPASAGLSRIADDYLRLQDPGRARAALLKIAPRDPGIWLQLARVAVAEGKRSEAAEALARVGLPGSPALERHQAALLYQELKDYRSALRILRGFAAENPARADVLADLGVCEFLAGEEEQATADLTRAIELDRDLLSAYLSLAYIHAARNRFGEAESVYDRALARPARAANGSEREMILKCRRELAARVGTHALINRANGLNYIS